MRDKRLPKHMNITPREKESILGRRKKPFESFEPVAAAPDQERGRGRKNRRRRKRRRREALSKRALEPAF